MLEDNIVRINGASGNIGVIAGSTELVIQAGNETLYVASGSALTLSADETGMNFWVSEGTVSQDGSEGPILAGAGAVISLDSADSSGASAEGLPLTAVFFPLPDAVFFTPDETAAVDFRFNPLGYKNETTRFEISPSRRFSHSVIRRDLPAHQTTADLESGTWWWRAWPAASGSLDSDSSGISEAAVFPGVVSGRLTVRRTPVPVPVFPSPEAELNDSHVHFRWILPFNAEAEGYVLEAADNPDFTNPRLFLETADSSFSTPLENGRWYWRIRARYSGSSGVFDGPFSAAIFFTLEHKSRPPAPSSPRNGASIAGDKRVYLSWQDMNDGPWLLTISTSPDMDNPLIETVTLNAYYGENLEPGSYYWQAAGSGGISPVWSFTVGKWSAPPITSTVPPPAMPVPPQMPRTPLGGLSPADKTVFGAAELRGITAIDFAWNPPEFAHNSGDDRQYRFILFGPGGKEVLSQTTGHAFFRLDDLSILGRGTFTWRVETLGSGETGESRFTIDLPELRRDPPGDPGVLYGR